MKIKNVSKLPVNLRKHDQIVDLRSTSWKDALSSTKDALSSTKVDEINLVHEHHDDKCKFNPVAKSVEPPELDK